MTLAEKPFLTLSDLEKLPKLERDSLLKGQRHIWKWDAQGNRLLNTRHPGNVLARQQHDPYRIFRPKEGQEFHVYQCIKKGWGNRSDWLQMRVVQWDAFTVLVENPDTFETIELSRTMLKEHGFDIGNHRKSDEKWFYTSKGMEKELEREDAAVASRAAAAAAKAYLASLEAMAK